MTLDECTTAIRNKVRADSGLAATLNLIVVRTAPSSSMASPPQQREQQRRQRRLQHGHHPDNLGAMIKGDLEPATAFMTGKLIKVTGDMSGHAPATGPVNTASPAPSRTSTISDARAFVASHRDEASAELFGITDLCREFGVTLRALRF